MSRDKINLGLSRTNKVFTWPKIYPTPEQIQAQCEKIQATWSPEEKERRRVCKPTFSIPVIAESEIALPHSYLR